MGFFSSVSGSEVDDFGKALARELAEKYPPTMENPKDDNKRAAPKASTLERRLTQLLETLYGKALTFKSEKKLGIYKRARLGNAFRWELDQLGYSKKFVEVATEGMVVFLSRKSDASVTK